jgi:hypothetical protein
MGYFSHFDLTTHLAILHFSKATLHCFHTTQLYHSCLILFHSFVYSFIHSLLRSFIHTFIHAFAPDGSMPFHPFHLIHSHEKKCCGPLMLEISKSKQSPLTLLLQLLARLLSNRQSCVYVNSFDT